MRKRQIDTSFEVNNVITTSNGTEYDLQNVDHFSIQCVVDVNTPSAKNFVAGEQAIETLTFDSKANTGDGDYVVVYDTAGLAWAVAADKTGSSPAPTGAVWAAIPAGRKAQANISAATDAASVAAIFETAFDGITGFTAVITSDDSAADGTMTMTPVLRGPVTASVVKDDDDAGAGSISAATTNAGVASTVELTDNEITITAHGLTTGLKGQLTTTDTLPAGLSTGTDYYVIVVDDDTIQLASSLANALAGTDIDITDQGTDGATHTFTATSLAGATVALQKSNDGTNFDTIGSATSITVDGNVWFSATDVNYRYARLQYTLTAGRLSSTNYIVGKG